MDTQRMKDLATPRNENRKDLPLGVDMKKVNKRNEKYFVDEKEIARNERKTVQITREGLRHYNKDQVIQPSVAFADELIAQKTAKEVKLGKGEWVKNGKIVKPKPKTVKK